MKTCFLCDSEADRKRTASTARAERKVQGQGGQGAHALVEYVRCENQRIQENSLKLLESSGCRLTCFSVMSLALLPLIPTV